MRARQQHIEACSQHAAADPQRLAATAAGSASQRSSAVTGSRHPAAAGTGSDPQRAATAAGSDPQHLASAAGSQHAAAGAVGSSSQHLAAGAADVARQDRRPLVSIIVSFYNDEPYLERTMEGIANQTYDKLEVIMVDDGSTDAGLAIVQRYAMHDPRIRVVSKPNTGVSSSRNAGVERASGEWLYFADADDWMAHDAIERFVAAATASPECDLVVSSFFRVHGMNAALKSGPGVGEVSREHFLSCMRRRPANLYYASLWNKFFRRSIVEENGLRLDTSIDFGEDHVFILAYLSCVRAVSLVEEGLYYYVDNQDSLLHQGLHPTGVVRMKCDTIRPYRRLFIQAGLYHSPLQKLRVLLFAFMPSTDYFVYEGSRELDVHEVPDHVLPASGEERDARIAELAAGPGAGGGLSAGCGCGGARGDAGLGAAQASGAQGAAAGEEGGATAGAAAGEGGAAAMQGESSVAADLPAGEDAAAAAAGATQGERPGHAS